MAGIDYSKLSDEELDQIAASGSTAGIGAEKPEPKKDARGVYQYPRKLHSTRELFDLMLAGENEDASLGMSGPKLALAGMGAGFDALGRGIKDKFNIAFRPEGEAGEAILKKIADERFERAKTNEMLFRNPEAKFGRFMGSAIPAMAAPARIPAQAGLFAGLDFLRAPSGDPTGLGGELATSLANAAESGGLTLAMGAPLSMLGRGSGALSRQYTPAGQTAMGIDAGARGQGLNLRIADLDPNSAFGRIESMMPGAGREVERQASQLRNIISATKDVPSKTGRSTQARVLEGENMRQAVVGGANDLLQSGRNRWVTLDDFIANNNVRPVVPDNMFRHLEKVAAEYTPKTAKGAWDPVKNPIFQRIDYYDEQAGRWMRQIAGSKYQDVAKGVPFDALNDMRMATGKALSRAKRDAAMPNAPESAMVAQRELATLYGKLNDDIANWGNINAKTGEAKALFDDANTFWRERIVPDVVNNRLAQKAMKGTWGQHPRGYAEPKQFYNDMVNNPDQLSRLREGMTPQENAMLDSFLAARDARKMMTTGEAPRAGASGLAGMVAAAGGHPVSALGVLATHLPGAGRAASSQPVKGFHFARNLFAETPPSVYPALDVLPRTAWGTAQYPKQEIEDWERRLLNRPLR